MRPFVLTPLILAALAVWSRPGLADLIADPGFENCQGSGQPVGWNNTSVNPTNFLCSPPAHGGTVAAHQVGANSSLAQAVATIAGHTYQFSFWLGGTGSGVGDLNAFDVSFGITTVLALRDAILPVYTLEEFTVTATNAVTSIEFAGFNATGIWSLDDVSLTDVTPSATPEPAGLTLLGGWLVGLWGMRRAARG